MVNIFWYGESKHFSKRSMHSVDKHFKVVRPHPSAEDEEFCSSCCCCFGGWCIVLVWSSRSRKSMDMCKPLKLCWRMRSSIKATTACSCCCCCCVTTPIGTSLSSKVIIWMAMHVLNRNKKWSEDTIIPCLIYWTVFLCRGFCCICTHQGKKLRLVLLWLICAGCWFFWKDLVDAERHSSCF